MAAGSQAQKSAEKLKDSAVRIKDSTARMERDSARMEFSADRRTELAADRTVFAAERTYAAWVRTGLVAMASGIGARPLLEGVEADWLIIMTGSVLVLFSAFCFGAAVWRNFYRPPPPPAPGVTRIHPALLIGVNGFLILVALAALTDILFGRVIR
jgi:putative membrane protein